jgi:hypothetical protein
VLKTLKIRIGSLCVAVLLIASCATTKVEDTWQADTELRKPKNVLVAAVLEFAPYRTLVEQEIVYHIRQSGTDANATVDVLGNTDGIDKDAALRAVKKSGADTVMLIRPVGRESKTVHNPEAIYLSATYAGGWFRYYNYSLRVIRTPEYDDVYDTTEIETTIFDTATGKRIWSATTKTTELQDSDALNSYIKKIGEEIRGSDLFAR